MNRVLYIILGWLFLVSCQNKELLMTDPCDELDGSWRVKIVVNWDDPATQARVMRATLFSAIGGFDDYDREHVDASGIRYISLPYGGEYQPLCYDYYANNIYFRNETDSELIEAYCALTKRETYELRATPVPGESTVGAPGEFYFDLAEEHFKVNPTSEDEELTLHFYPRNVMRQFTFRVNNVVGAKNISDTKGAVSGMAASFMMARGTISDEPATILFESGEASAEEVGYIEGYFYTFGPVAPYSNRFTIEAISKGSLYYTAYWDVSSQITESMADRPAKLARDGYDILIHNDPDTHLPEIPETEQPDKSDGFEVGVGEWDNVDIYL